MTHEEARNRWHDQCETGKPDRALEAHLEGCASCQEYVRDMRTVLEVLDTAQRDTARLRLDPSRRVRPTRRLEARRNLLTWVRAAAVIGLVSAAAYWAVMPRGTEQTPPIPAHGDGPGTESFVYGVTLRGETGARQLALADRASTEQVQVYWIYAKLTTGESDPKRKPRDSHQTSG